MSEHTVSLRTYLNVFVTLIFLTMVTYLVSFEDLGVFTLPVAIGIAILKATLVVLFFMHVKYSSRLVGRDHRGRRLCLAVPADRGHAPRLSEPRLDRAVAYLSVPFPST
jgi:cytochrome c oxidase subunit IV